MSGKYIVSCPELLDLGKVKPFPSTRIQNIATRIQNISPLGFRIWIQSIATRIQNMDSEYYITEPIKTAFHIYKLFCCSLEDQLLVTMIFRTAMTEKVHWEWREANFVINKN